MKTGCAIRTVTTRQDCDIWHATGAFAEWNNVDERANDWLSCGHFDHALHTTHYGG
jgi:hypothetical protein